MRQIDTSARQDVTGGDGDGGGDGGRGSWQSLSASALTSHVSGNNTNDVSTFAAHSWTDGSHGYVRLKSLAANQYYWTHRALVHVYSRSMGDCSLQYVEPRPRSRVVFSPIHHGASTSSEYPQQLLIAASTAANICRSALLIRFLQSCDDRDAHVRHQRQCMAGHIDLSSRSM